MSYKTLLVHVEADQACDDRIKLASQVAGMFAAKVVGLGCEGFAPVMATGFAATDGMVIEAVRERIAIDLPLAEQRFRTLVGNAEIVADWITGYEYPAAELAQHARGADLIVASRPRRGAAAAFSANLPDVVLEAGVPVLVCADTPAKLKAEHVLVAWKNTRESRRALADALPFLMRADRVTLLTVSGEAESVEQPGLQEVVSRLARHGVVADTLVAPKGSSAVAEVIDRTAGHLQADLVVMGAYGHPRLQEWALGGATEDLLAASSRHILFSH
ncbi:universal stress protein [Phenylobacterium montanum]|uniref:Universal stress protein n=1 Tax=Phenylobacterium montanum TaxID=2823693 RepID=A0A975IU96_9CAUL|nr:universal stress protein [Caulobacter sp. S6]QUD87525.1 universal stress protein [Caulobacter sp. S6]